MTFVIGKTQLLYTISGEPGFGSVPQVQLSFLPKWRKMWKFISWPCSTKKASNSYVEFITLDPLLDWVLLAFLFR